MISEEMKRWIDEATYEDLLRRWRTAPVGSPWFSGEVGQYYKEKMAQRRQEVGSLEHTRVSKAIGFQKPEEVQA